MFIWGAPIWVPRDAGEQELESKRQELEDSLKSITAEADEAVAKKEGLKVIRS